jgi:hypothetical protein
VTDRTPEQNNMRARYTEAMEAANPTVRPLINAMFYAHFEEMAKLRSDLVALRAAVRQLIAPHDGAVFAVLTADGWKPVLEVDKIRAVLDTAEDTDR